MSMHAERENVFPEYLVFLSALLYPLVCPLRLAILADIHLNTTDDTGTTYGIYGQDSTPSLLQAILDDLH